MPNPFFQFKQFTVWHDQCAMKVGTDGVLLGAWVPITNCRSILDVGTGTGLIALQLAQRSSIASITAIEIDEAAARQAAENIHRSPWPNRIHVITGDFRNFTPQERFDLIVSNPPYFVDALKCPNKQRNQARHAEGLNYDLLFRHSNLLLTEQGTVAVVIPAETEKFVLDAAGIHSFYLYRRMKVYTKPSKPYRRLLLLLGKDPLHSFQEETLYITQENGEYSQEYRTLTGDFYLKM